MLDDAELLRRYAEEKSEDAFAELVRRHLNLVYFAALRQVGGDPHHAHDVAQSVFTDLARKASTLSRRPILVSWLHTSTRFAAAKLRRAESRRRRHELEAAAVKAIDDPSAAHDWENLRPLIDDAVHTLNEREREVVLLRFFAGRAFAEIGATLHVSEDAARMRVERALAKLRALLAQRGVTSSAAALTAAFAHQAALAAPAGLGHAIVGSALASAAATSSPALSLFQIMTTTKFAAATAGAVLVLSIGATVHEVRASRAAQTALTAAHASLARATAQLDAATREASDARAAETSLDDQLSIGAAPHPTTDPAPSPQAAAAGAAAARPWSEPAAREAMRALEAAHPEVHRALLAMGKSTVLANYRALCATLKLTPDEIDRFATIVMNAKPVDYWGGTRRSSPLGTYQYSFAPTDTPLSTDERDAQLQQLLGADGLEQFRTFERLGVAREFARMAADSAIDAGTPLTADQSNTLLQAVAATSASYQAGGNVKLAEIDWSAVRDRTARLLPPAQAAVIAAAIEQVRFNRDWSAAVRAAAAQPPTR